METKAEISKAIIKVMKAVKGMEKNSRVGGNTASAYNGTKDQDVKEVINDALQRNGLCILPIDIQETTQIDRWEQEEFYNSKSQGIKQKQSVFTKVNVKYMLLHESGESIELAGYGHGIDSQDKGAGKATTYALKNCLLYSFLTPVGKIDDTDLKHSNDIAIPQKTYQPTELDWINLKSIFDKKSEKIDAEKYDAIKKAVEGKNPKYYDYTLKTLNDL